MTETEAWYYSKADREKIFGNPYFLDSNKPRDNNKPKKESLKPESISNNSPSWLMPVNWPH